MDFTFLPKNAQDTICEKAAWTSEQSAVFLALCKGAQTDEGIMQSLHLNRKAYYRIKKQISQKIIWVAAFK